MRLKGFAHIILIILIVIVGVVYLSFANPNSDNEEPTIVQRVMQSSPTPTPYRFPYKNPVLEKQRSYRTILVGDSITASLGANANKLREDLIDYYPDSEFVNYNYGYGSTNIESLPQRLHEQTTYLGETNPPILKQGFELIIIESFAFNPLSEYPLEEGLQKQTEVLERSVRDILQEKPHVALAFMTPIAPSLSEFGKGTVDLSPEQRSYWATERIAYIDNHRKFAEDHGIPVIDVYEASLKEDGTVDLRYVADDFIHPSEEGIDLISQEIADYIYENEVFPK